MWNILGPINDRSYGLVCANIVQELSKLTDVTLWPIGQVQPNLHYDYQTISKSIKNQDRYQQGPSLRIWHQFDLAQHVGSPRIGFPIFELDTFNSREKCHLTNQDYLFVCSKWAKQILSPIKKDVKVVPLGVDRTIFHETPKKSGPFRFINVGKWEIRKGHDVLVECFNKAFTEKDDVELYLSCHNPFLSPDETNTWVRIYKNSPLGNKIQILPWYTTQLDLAKVYSQINAGVFLSRAEGWNLEALELLSCGKQLIITNYSGHTEFCTKDNSHLIEIDKMERAFDGKWFFGQGNWAMIEQNQIDQCVEYMRKVYQNNTLNTAGIKTAEKFSWAETARLIEEM